MFGWLKKKITAVVQNPHKAVIGALAIVSLSAFGAYFYCQHCSCNDNSLRANTQSSESSYYANIVLSDQQVQAIQNINTHQFIDENMACVGVPAIFETDGDYFLPEERNGKAYQRLYNAIEECKQVCPGQLNVVLKDIATCQSSNCTSYLKQFNENNQSNLAILNAKPLNVRNNPNLVADLNAFNNGIEIRWDDTFSLPQPVLKCCAQFVDLLIAILTFTPNPLQPDYVHLFQQASDMLKEHPELKEYNTFWRDNCECEVEIAAWNQIIEALQEPQLSVIGIDEGFLMANYLWQLEHVRQAIREKASRIANFSDVPISRHQEMISEKFEAMAKFYGVEKEQLICALNGRSRMYSDVLKYLYTRYEHEVSLAKGK